MSQYPPPHIPYYTPPMTRFYNRRPTSVTVLAIIGIIFGALGVLCTPLALVALFIDPLAELMEMQYEGVALVSNVVMNILHIILAGILLVSSIAALKLDPRGRKGMILVNAVSLALVPVGLVMVVLWDLGEIGAMDDGEMIGAAVGGVCGLVLAVVYPVCVFYFLTRPHVKAAFGEGPQEPWPPQMPPYQPPHMPPYQPPRMPPYQPPR